MRSQGVEGGTVSDGVDVVVQRKREVCQREGVYVEFDWVGR